MISEPQSDVRCEGTCCREFVISRLSYSELLQAETDAEDARVKDMVLAFLGPLEEGDVHTYTCKNFDGRNCLIYEDRPRLCRDYGTEKVPCVTRGVECKLVTKASLLRNVDKS